MLKLRAVDQNIIGRGLIYTVGRVSIQPREIYKQESYPPYSSHLSSSHLIFNSLSNTLQFSLILYRPGVASFFQFQIHTIPTRCRLRLIFIHLFKNHSDFSISFYQLFNTAIMVRITAFAILACKFSPACFPPHPLTNNSKLLPLLLLLPLIPLALLTKATELASSSLVVLATTTLTAPLLAVLLRAMELSLCALALAPNSRSESLDAVALRVVSLPPLPRLLPRPPRPE